MVKGGRGGTIQAAMKDPENSVGAGIVVRQAAVPRREQLQRDGGPGGRAVARGQGYAELHRGLWGAFRQHPHLLLHQAVGLEPLSRVQGKP